MRTITAVDMDAKTLTIIWLSLQLTAMGYLVTKQAYRIGYLEGRQSVYTENTYVKGQDTCYALNGKGCEDYR